MVEKQQDIHEYSAGPIDSIIVSTLQSMDRGSFGTKDKILFFKELAYLLKGGISLFAAIKLIGDSSENYALQEISRNISAFLNRGKSFSYALNRLPDYFDAGDYSLIKTGEMSGELPLILQSLATEYVYIKDMKNKYIGALIYPAILIVVAIVAVLALFLLVLPNIFSIAESFQNLQLPWITRTLQSISVFLQTQWKVIFGIIAGLTLLGGIFFSTEFGKKNRFKVLLSIPMIGTMTKYFYIVKFCRYMKLMMNAGMNYIQTFQLLRDILHIPAYHEMIERVLVGLNKGENIYKVLQYETELIPPDVSIMIKVGEESANLSNSLDNILEMYQEDLNTIIMRSSKIIEPVMLIFVGGIVVVIALGIFGLILQIMEGSGM
ncbi:MAG TPA: type II secretion system F family protein [Candidatus Absconditabacterales bacterium]|nr:type II secretion system F family protein [Candidatus Absconditabacterales bacterium]